MAETQTPATTGAAVDGLGMVRLDLAGTAVFAVATVVALAVRHRGVIEVVFVVLSLLLFAAGIALMLWAYALAVERSRTHVVGVAQLYLLTGNALPRAVKRIMWSAWAVQILGSLAVGIIGASGLKDGQHNALAFGALVPIFGVGCQGACAIRQGRFPLRGAAKSRPKPDSIG